MDAARRCGSGRKLKEPRRYVGALASVRGLGLAGYACVVLLLLAGAFAVHSIFPREEPRQNAAQLLHRAAYISFRGVLPHASGRRRYWVGPSFRSYDLSRTPSVLAALQDAEFVTIPAPPQSAPDM